MRLKPLVTETDEERKLRIDKILEKNTRAPDVCISCLEVIFDDELKLTTKHGLYHGPPLLCMDGRMDDDLPWDTR